MKRSRKDGEWKSGAASRKDGEWKSGVASLQALALRACNKHGECTPEAVAYSASRAFQGKPPQVKTPPDDNHSHESYESEDEENLRGLSMHVARTSKERPRFSDREPDEL